MLIDARAPERFRGDTEPVDPVAGHIPGAVNVPTTANLDERGRFLPPERLREVYAGVGADTASSVAAYCGSGVTAAHDLLAMEVAGIRRGALPGQLERLDHRPRAARRDRVISPPGPRRRR